MVAEIFRFIFTWFKCSLFVELGAAPSLSSLLFVLFFLSLLDAIYHRFTNDVMRCGFFFRDWFISICLTFGYNDFENTVCKMPKLLLKKKTKHYYQIMDSKCYVKLKIELNVRQPVQRKRNEEEKKRVQENFSLCKTQCTCSLFNRFAINFHKGISQRIVCVRISIIFFRFVDVRPKYEQGIWYWHIWIAKHLFGQKLYIVFFLCVIQLIVSLAVLHTFQIERYNFNDFSNRTRSIAMCFVWKRKRSTNGNKEFYCVNSAWIHTTTTAKIFHELYFYSWFDALQWNRLNFFSFYRYAKV